MRSIMIAGAIALGLVSAAHAGMGYRITSGDGGVSTTYDVNFGGGRAFEQFTAFDPNTKKFVYLQWKRGTKAPEPVARIWDYRTGQVIALYKFPEAVNPLPIIPSIDDLTICPMTGSKKMKKELRIAYD